MAARSGHLACADLPASGAGAATLRFRRYRPYGLGCDLGCSRRYSRTQAHGFRAAEFEPPYRALLRTGDGPIHSCADPVQEEVATMVGTATKKVVPALENGVAFRLQHSLIELIDLGLHAKQAHWNVVGPNFGPLHAQFDQIGDMARLTADAVANRLAALEVSPDGTLVAVVESPLEPFPLGWLSGPRAVEAMLVRLEHMARMNRTRISELRGIDPVAETILVELAGELDKAAWMLRVQQE